MNTDWTFKALDEATGVAKGTAFRAFKALALEEGPDFRVLRATADAEAIAALKREGRVYANSVNVVLLTDRGRRAVAAALANRG